MTKGQQFAKDMRRNLSIGTRTFRWGSTTFPDSDIHKMILESIAHATHHDDWYGEARTELFRTAFAALCSYEKHIWNGRADPVLVAYCNSLTPWHLCNLLGDMVDAKITNVGEGERFFAEFLDRNRTQIYDRVSRVGQPAPSAWAIANHQEVAA